MIAWGLDDLAPQIPVNIGQVAVQVIQAACTHSLKYTTIAYKLRTKSGAHVIQASWFRSCF